MPGTMAMSVKHLFGGTLKTSAISQKKKTISRLYAKINPILIVFVALLVRSKKYIIVRQGCTLYTPNAVGKDAMPGAQYPAEFEALLSNRFDVDFPL